VTGFHESSVWWLLLLLLVPLAAWPAFAPRRRAAIGFPSAALLRSAGASFVARTWWLPTLLRTLAIALLAVCIARPIKANEQTRVYVEGIAMEIVVDRSSSMLAMDFQKAGRRADRLTALKDVATAFILGGDGLPGRPNDLVGLVAFARYADSLSPLTLDHDYLVQVLEGVEVAGERAEDGTAIGEAVALAAERLRDATERPTGDVPKPRSKAIVLLTDGENNAGDIDPMTAAEICRTYGIKLYAIGMGTIGEAPFPMQTPFGGTQLVPVPVKIDEKLLKEMAAVTGGQYFRATDSKSLASIYETIDALEKTATEQRRYLQFRDLAVEPFDVAGRRFPPLLAIVLVLVAADVALGLTRWRTLP
jgi:Ca-activated chloride channel family protein